MEGQIFNIETGRKVKKEGYIGLQISKNTKITIYIISRLIRLKNPEIDFNITPLCKKIKKDSDILSQSIYNLRNGGVLILGDPRHGESIQDYFLSISYALFSKKILSILRNSTIFTEKESQIEELKKQKIGKNFFGLDEFKEVKTEMDKLIKDSEAVQKRNFIAHPLWCEQIYNNMSRDTLNIVCVGRSHIYNTINRSKDIVYNAPSLQQFLKKLKISTDVFSITQEPIDLDNYDKDEVKGIKNPEIKNIYVLTDENIEMLDEEDIPPL